MFVCLNCVKLLEIAANSHSAVLSLALPLHHLKVAKSFSNFTVPQICFSHSSKLPLALSSPSPKKSNPCCVVSLGSTKWNSSVDN